MLWPFKISGIKPWAVAYKRPVLPLYNTQPFSWFWFHGANTVLFSQLFIPPPPPSNPNSLLNYPDKIRCTQVNVMILGHSDCRQIKR